MKVSWYDLARAVNHALSKRGRLENPAYAAELVAVWKLTLRSMAAERNKTELLGLARAGAARPRKVTRLGGCCSSYMCKSNYAYDPKFTRELHRVAPESWFKCGRRPGLTELSKVTTKTA